VDDEYVFTVLPGYTFLNPIENIIAAKEHACLDNRRPGNIWIDDLAH
jgi:hypothetical protein